MFCPKCGNANQQENSYCRNCGTFLPDFNKIAKRETTPEQQITISATFNFLSALISLILTILLHIFYTGKEGTPIIIYVVIGFLTANFFWQAQAYWRTLQLKKHLPKRRIETEVEEKIIDSAFSTDKVLPQADFSNFVPPSVVEDTTKHLKQKIKSS
ncbi:MAG: zinc ribbon domain-containing protein [Blastocatellia bacterium]|nr:zinc ribbon domain-containing protein [Blastocatellia bacterium]